MKRVGILTIYYKNYNYGGQLQAYALAHYINSVGAKCEQITFNRTQGLSFLLKKNLAFWNWSADKKMIFLKNHISKFASKKKKSKTNRSTIEKFNLFMDATPHSDVYTRETIAEANSKYELFIAGSDQVWNVDYCTDEYFLSFVKGHTCVSYAASMNTLDIESKQKLKICKWLDRFDAISVREQGAKSLLNELLPEKKIQVVVDPVFLLSKSEWIDSATMPTGIDGDYIFVYLIQSEKHERSEECISLGRELQKKVYCITSPGWESDLAEGADILTDGVGPKEFLGMINGASCVITDSFHAVAFSILLNKEFYVYGHDDRKDSLLSEFGLQERLVEDGGLEVSAMHPIDFEATNVRIESYVANSKRYIESWL